MLDDQACHDFLFYAVFLARLQLDLAVWLGPFFPPDIHHRRVNRIIFRFDLPLVPQHGAQIPERRKLSVVIGHGEIECTQARHALLVFRGLDYSVLCGRVVPSAEEAEAVACVDHLDVVNGYWRGFMTLCILTRALGMWRTAFHSPSRVMIWSPPIGWDQRSVIEPPSKGQINNALTSTDPSKEKAYQCALSAKRSSFSLLQLGDGRDWDESGVSVQTSVDKLTISWSVLEDCVYKENTNNDHRRTGLTRALAFTIEVMEVNKRLLGKLEANGHDSVGVSDGC
jgi:hypothetical protein